MYLDGIEVTIINEFIYNNEVWVTVIPKNFAGIEREVKKSRLYE